MWRCASKYRESDSKSAQRRFKLNTPIHSIGSFKNMSLFRNEMNHLINSFKNADSFRNATCCSEICNGSALYFELLTGENRHSNWEYSNVSYAVTTC